MKNKGECIINNFDFDTGCDELCCVGDDGSINFISTYQSNSNPVASFGKIIQTYSNVLKWFNH